MCTFPACLEEEPPSLLLLHLHTDLWVPVSVDRPCEFGQELLLYRPPAARRPPWVK